MVEESVGVTGRSAAMLNSIAQIKAKIRQIDDRQELISRRMLALAQGQATNLGGYRMLTETRSGLRMFIDGRDTGSGLEIIHSGYIEPDVMKVLQRCFKPGATFLDVGTNFGFYTLFAAQQMGGSGRVYSFEANPFLIPFIEGSAYINGLSNNITLINKAVADREGTAQFGFSFAHIGGGSLLAGSNDVAECEHVEVPLVTIDSVIPADVQVDVIKLDVEGHEAAALRGLKQVIARSPDVQIVLEFFPGMQGAGGAEVLDALTDCGLQFWKIGNRGRLHEVSRDELTYGPDCYLLAARTKPDDRTLEIGPAAIRYAAQPGSDDSMMRAGRGEVLVHGPYWYLPQGSYEITVHGKIKGTVRAAVTHEFGFEIASDQLTAKRMSFVANTNVDLRYFEVVLRDDDNSEIRVDRITVRDIS